MHKWSRIFFYDIYGWKKSIEKNTIQWQESSSWFPCFFYRIWIYLRGIFAASSLGEGIDSLHLDFEDVGVAVDVVVEVVVTVAWEVAVVTVVLVVEFVVVEDDCKSILMIPLSRLWLSGEDFEVVTFEFILLTTGKIGLGEVVEDCDDATLIGTESPGARADMFSFSIKKSSMWKEIYWRKKEAEKSTVFIIQIPFYSLLNTESLLFTLWEFGAWAQNTNQMIISIIL